MPIVILKTQRYPGVGTSKRQYPANVPLSISAEELANLNSGFRKLPDLEILEKPEPPAGPPPSIEQAAQAIESLCHQPSNQATALDDWLRQFEPYPHPVNEAFWARIMRANVPERVKLQLRDFINDRSDWGDYLHQA